jgi:mRNA interferase HigB
MPLIAIAPAMGAFMMVRVRVIARGTLNLFVKNRVDRGLQQAVRVQPDAWFAEVQRATWKNSAELKQQYRSASVVSAERVVFDIKGNEFRLVAAINYDYQVLLVKRLGTHREYDKIDVKRVEYEKSRYADSSNSNG